MEWFLGGLAAGAPSAAATARIEAGLAELKSSAVAAGNEALAKRLWCYEQALEVHRLYREAFERAKARDYYQAWCILERVEIGLMGLERHLEDNWNEFALGFISEKTERLQALFPYRMFMSPEWVFLETTCSICNQPVGIRIRCNHRKGEIYAGKECIHIHPKAEMLGMSLVPNPVQKYSVVFPTSSKPEESADPYDYTVVGYLVDRLPDPFSGWGVQETRIRHPHALFSKVHPEDNCPCGSGGKYRNCCLKEPGVLRPHFQFFFDQRPLLPTKEIEYHYPAGGYSSDRSMAASTKGGEETEE